MPPSDISAPSTPTRRAVLMYHRPVIQSHDSKRPKDPRSSPTQPIAMTAHYHHVAKSKNCSNVLSRIESAPVIPLLRENSIGSAASSSSRRSIFESFWEREQSCSDKKFPRSVIIDSLPSPMRRLRKHAGVYPLLKPTSILRKRAISAPGRLPAVSDTHTDSTDECSHSHASSNSSSSSTSFSCSPLNSSRHLKTVQFDHRITVTEFDNISRQWYSDCELEYFKSETVALAKQYLCRHPQEIPLYSCSTLDPVTRKARQKALFTMPALSCIDLDEEDLQEHRPSKSIRRILVVDKNEMFLSLFRRSLQAIFEASEICTVTSVAHATQFMQEKHSFDMVISEDPQLFRDGSVHCATCLCIGVQSASTMTTSTAPWTGADLMWGKPPPRMDSVLRRSLETTLEAKRCCR